MIFVGKVGGPHGHEAIILRMTCTFQNEVRANVVSLTLRYHRHLLKIDAGLAVKVVAESESDSSAIESRNNDPSSVSKQSGEKIRREPSREDPSPQLHDLAGPFRYRSLDQLE
jgi:hypothetical protein